MIYMAMPEGTKLQAAVGRVSIRHGQMEFVLRMTIKSLCEVSPEEGRLATARLTGRELRERIEALAKKRFQDGTVLARLQALLERSRQASKERNELLHGVFAKELDGDELFMGDGDPGPLPKLAELNALATRMADLTKELNLARLDGFLSEAIRQSKPFKVGL
jgi:hypothetical protein